MPPPSNEASFFLLKKEEAALAKPRKYLGWYALFSANDDHGVPWANGFDNFLVLPRGPRLCHRVGQKEGGRPSAAGTQVVCVGVEAPG